MATTKCPVCMATRVFPLRHLKGQRTGRSFRLYFCGNCHSLFNPSGYKEDDRVLMADNEWLVNHFAQSVEWSTILISELKTRHTQARTFLDIGCGIGATVLQAKSLGLEAAGVDSNHFAVEYARDHFSLDLKCGRFGQGLFKRNSI